MSDLIFYRDQVETGIFEAMCEGPCVEQDGVAIGESVELTRAQWLAEGLGTEEGSRLFGIHCGRLFAGEAIRAGLRYAGSSSVEIELLPSGSIRLSFSTTS